MTTFFLLASLPLAAVGQAQGKVEFETCSTRTADGALEAVLIRPTRASRRVASFDCHVVLSSLQPRRVLHAASIDAAGAEFGLVLARERLGLFRAAVKLGNDDGRLLLIGPDGALQDLPGGPFIFWKGRYLVMHHHPDPRSLVVIDTTTGDQVLAQDVSPVEVDDAVGSEFLELDGKLVTSVARKAAEDGGRAAVQIDVEPAKATARTLTKVEASRLKPIRWVAPLGPAAVRCGCE